jgi:hypothetical protein
MTIDVALPRSARFSIGRVLADSSRIVARNAMWLLALTFAVRSVVLLAPSDYNAPLSDQLLNDLARALASALCDATIILGVMRILIGHQVSIRDVTAGLRSIVPVTIVTYVYGFPWTLSIIVEAVWPSASDTEMLVRWLATHAVAIAVFVPLSVATQANVIEGLGAFAGLARSVRLTKGRRWAIFAVTMIPLVVIYALRAGSVMLPAIVWPDSDASQSATLEGAADYLISALSSAYFSVQTTVLHYYLRREKDGIESGEVAHVFD